MAVDTLRRKITIDKATEKQDLQLTAITSIFIASKLIEVKPLKLAFVVETLGHNKFTAV